MATMTQPAGFYGLRTVGGPQLVRSLVFSKGRENKGRGNARPCVESSRAVRALSGKFCSSSGGQAQSVTASAVQRLSRKEKTRGVAGCARASSGLDELVSGKGLFSQSVEGLHSVDAENGRNCGSAIRSLADELGNPTPREDSIFGTSEAGSADSARQQSLVQGFGENSFVGEFAMDVNVNVGTVGGGTDFDAMAVTVPVYQPRWIWFAQSAEQENIFIDRAINATIVGSAGILALTKMLTVDHDYWHGWTLREILQYAPVHNWFAYEELLKTHPVFAKMMISGTVYALGDWIAQCVEGKPALDFNRPRMLRSGLVGFCLHGSMSHFYYHFCEWLFPFNGWWVLPLKVGFDQTLWSGFWNSVYFITVGLLRLESPVRIIKELRQTFVPLLTAGWKLWPFAHVITYGVIPVEQRLLWVDMVEIVWVTILATYSNEKSEARIAEAESSIEVVDAAVASVAIDEVAVEKVES